MVSQTEIDFAMAAYRRSASERGHQGPDVNGIRDALEIAEAYRAGSMRNAKLGLAHEPVIYHPEDGGIIISPKDASAIRKFFEHKYTGPRW